MGNQLSRRQFISRTAAASTVIGLGLTAPASAWGANDKLNVAVMGVNSRGRALANHFAKSKNCEVRYLCDVDEKTFARPVAALQQRGHKKPKLVNDFRTALDDKNVDALVIAAPDHWHGPATILACAAGKHVYVEKPACHNGREGELMIAAARKHKRIVQVGTQRRSSSKLAEAMKLLHDGEIGKTLFARGWINSTRPSIGKGKKVPVPKNLDYKLWQGPAPQRDYRDNLIHYKWHWFWHYGTGELGNNGIHALDMCRWGLGVDYPKRVVCAGAKLHFNDDQQTPDTQIVTFQFDDHKMINWEHRTWHRRGFAGYPFGVIFYGEKGSLQIVGNKYTVYDMNGKKQKQVDVDRGDQVHQDNFLQSIRENKKSAADVEIGVTSTALCHLGNIAYRSDKTVHFDPQKKKITDNDPAIQQLWSREYRSGWQPKV